MSETPLWPKDELRALIRSKLVAGMTPDQAADAVAGLFWQVDDQWDSVDVSTWTEPGKTKVSRSLRCEVFRESHDIQGQPQPNRTVA